jgi:hypothetical protein
MRRYAVSAPWVGAVALASALGLVLGSRAGGEVANPRCVDELRPASESDHVWIRDPVWVRFSEPVDSSTMTPAGAAGWRLVVEAAGVAGVGR